HIALQRAFFNFAFMAVVDKQNNSMQPQISAASTMLPGVSYPVSFTLPAGTDLSQYTFEWSASSGTIIPDNASQNITYIPDNDLSIRIALITLVMTDACGRQYFETHNINMQLDPNNDGKISVPQLLSPNKDGSGNDYLHIKNIELYPDNEITIYNRWGNIVYKEKGYDNSTRFFAGSLKMKSTAVTDGVFYYVLTVNNTFTNTNTNSGSKELIKGYFILRR
ncbi:MAG TPA: gliding motility-associated C-terminal domain-containing protein, partial [Sphingobacteriaceae bacterium]